MDVEEWRRKRKELQDYLRDVGFCSGCWADVEVGIRRLIDKLEELLK